MRALWVYLIILTLVAEWACGYEAELRKWDSAVAAMACIFLAVVGLLWVSMLDDNTRKTAAPPAVNETPEVH